MTAFDLFLGACVVAGFLVCWWGITRLVGRMADNEAAKEARQARFRQLSPEAPRASGVGS